MAHDTAGTHYIGVGDAMPEVTLPLLGGGTLNLGALRGKHVLLFMWASW